MKRWRLPPEALSRLAHCLNFRVAAEELLLTPPAVSTQIKALEAEIAATRGSAASACGSLTATGFLELSPGTKLSLFGGDTRKCSINLRPGA